jgi:pilus assembly protein TadC
VAIGALVALRGSGYDPIPSYLIGEMIGSAFTFVVPVVLAIAWEARRRKTKANQTDGGHHR